MRVIISKLILLLFVFNGCFTQTKNNFRLEKIKLSKTTPREELINMVLEPIEKPKYERRFI